jgi:hypothetical protein
MAESIPWPFTQNPAEVREFQWSVKRSKYKIVVKEKVETVVKHVSITLSAMVVLLSMQSVTTKASEENNGLIAMALAGGEVCHAQQQMSIGKWAYPKQSSDDRAQIDSMREHYVMVYRAMSSDKKVEFCDGSK